MLLTLCTGSFQRQISDPGGADGMSLLDLPRLAIEQLQLHGLNIPASMLTGWSMDDFDRLRDRADKVGCPCLVLIEDTPRAFADPDDDTREQAVDRVHRLAAAASRLGCNSLGVSIAGEDSEQRFDLAVETLKDVMPAIERLELNMLIAPADGMTHDPGRLIELIKRIGGFRIGSLPDFAHAEQTEDPVETLRQLAPYAGAIQATIHGFTKNGKHKGCDLVACINAIRNVGFVNTVAIDYDDDGDPMKAVEQARTMLQDAIDAEQ